MILIFIGITIMTLGMFKAMIERRFQVKLHFISLSDLVGSLFVIIGIITEKIEYMKLIFAVIFLIIWSPYLSHMILKAYVSRINKR